MSRIKIQKPNPNPNWLSLVLVNPNPNFVQNQGYHCELGFSNPRNN